MKRSCLGVFLMAVASQASAAAIQDSGRITKLYVAGDSVAVHLDSGFHNAVVSNVCSTAIAAGGYWAGQLVAEKSMVAALMSAKISGSKVTLTITGCESGGGNWFKISEVYIAD